MRFFRYFVAGMWCFSLDKFFGFDRICFINIDKRRKLSPGDLIKDGDSFFIVLGETIEYSSLYKRYIYKPIAIELVEKKLFSEQTIKLVHRMVKTRFSSYKNVVNLFLPNLEIEKFLSYKTKNKKDSSQYLIIFPDLWTYYNHCSDKNSEIIHGQTTNIKKAKLFWLIKAGKLEKIISTGSQIFRDFRNLKKITIYFPHRRYYKHQKDPRYHTYEVVKKLIKLYNCELETKYDYNI